MGRLQRIFDDASLDFDDLRISEAGWHVSTRADFPRALLVSGDDEVFQGHYALFPFKVNDHPAWMKERPDGEEHLIFFKYGAWRISKVKSFLPTVVVSKSQFYSTCKEAPADDLFSQCIARKLYDRKRKKKLTIEWGTALNAPSVVDATLSWHDKQIKIFASDKDYIVGKEHARAGTGYKLHTLNLNSTDIFMDIGAHVGVVSLAAVKAGVQQVISVEPSHSTALCLRENLRDAVAAGRCIVVEKALVGEGFFFCRMYQSKNRQFFNSACSGRKRASLGQPHYACVATATELLQTYLPTVIKLDCEGSEIYLTQARSSDAWGHVRLIVGEYDFKHNTDPKDYFAFEKAWHPEFHFKLAGRYPDIETDMDRPDSTRWVFKGRANMNTGRVFTATRCMGPERCNICLGVTRSSKRKRA